MKGVGCLQSKYPNKLLSAVTGALKHWPISSSSVVFAESFRAYGILLVFKTTPGIWHIKGWKSRTFRNLGKTFPPRSTREVNNVSCHFSHGLSLSEASSSPSSLRLQIPPVSLRASGDACPSLVSKISTVFSIHSSCHGQSSISGSQGTTELNATQIFPFRMLLGSPEAYGRFFSVRETGMCLQL